MMRSYHQEVLGVLNEHSQTNGELRQRIQSRSRMSISNSLRWLRRQGLIEPDGVHGRMTKWLVTDKGRAAL